MKKDISFAEFLALEHRPMRGAQFDPGGGIVEGAGGNLNVFDVFQQATFTDLVRRRLQTMFETLPAIGSTIAPNFSVYDRTIEREIAEVASFGVAQFRAPDATPAIYSPQIRYTQEVVSLLLVDEMQRIGEDLHLRLTSPTSSVRARAGVDLITAAAILQLRNENRTELMRWQAFMGQNIVVQYPQTGQQITVQYNYLNGHQPTVSIPWSDRANSTPIDDMIAWQTQIANDLGYYGCKFHMNSVTWKELQRSNQPRGYLTQTDRNVFLPTKKDICSLLLGGDPDAQDAAAQGGRVAEAPQIIVSDAGYRDTSAGYARGLSAMTKFIPDRTVLVTGPYVFEGEPIADVADGMVAIRQDFNRLAWLQGMQSEILLDHYTHYFRQASARFVRLRRPEAFLTATVN
jgi:hypothetical protein